MKDIIKKAIRNLGFHDNFDIQQLTDGGSTREFYRVKEDNKSVILLLDTAENRTSRPGSEQEFDNYIAIASVLKETNTPIPEIYYYDKKEHFLLAEDVGDLSLELAIKKHNYPVPETYKQVIDTLLNMQIMGLSKSSHCPPIITRKFDYDTFRWETQYFTQYFLGKYCKMEHPALAVIKDIENNQLLQTEFHNLAMKLVNEPFYFMHRDFQSKNIFLKQNRKSFSACRQAGINYPALQGEGIKLTSHNLSGFSPKQPEKSIHNTISLTTNDYTIYILDFQGARQGLLAYDIVSLLKDPYMLLEDKTREELINYYTDSLTNIWKININMEQFKQTFLYTGLQRNMQALGAFSFLSLVKNKSSFLQYIPAGVNYLKKALSDTTEFPVLKKIVNSIPLF